MEIHLKCPTSDINTGLRVTALFWEGKVQTAKFKVSVTMAAASTSSECQWNAFFCWRLINLFLFTRVYNIYIYTIIYVCTVYTVWFCFRFIFSTLPHKNKKKQYQQDKLNIPSSIYQPSIPLHKQHEAPASHIPTHSGATTLQQNHRVVLSPTIREKILSSHGCHGGFTMLWPWLPVITGYKWDYTFYKWGFLSTYNW